MGRIDALQLNCRTGGASAIARTSHEKASRAVHSSHLRRGNQTCPRLVEVLLFRLLSSVSCRRPKSDHRSALKQTRRFHAAAEAEQIRAWEREIELLRAALAEVGEAARRLVILIEVPLLRLGKRLDVVLLAPGVVALIEFKIGATRYDSADKAQTEGYAHSLRDFHEVSQRRLVIPILCAEKAPDRPIRIAAADRVADLVFTNASTLARALKALEHTSIRTPLSWTQLASTSRHIARHLPLSKLHRRSTPGMRSPTSDEATRVTPSCKPQQARCKRSQRERKRRGLTQSAS